MREIGAFEAKNKFGQLLDWVERGEEVTITRHGKEVARLVPAKPGINRAEAHAAFERRMELVDVDVLAAQDAVDVVDADLDVRQPALLDDPAGIRRRLYLARFHSSPCAPSRQTSR